MSKHKEIDVEKIEHCGQCQMTPAETALLCGVKTADITDGKYCEIYIKGKLEAELAVRRSLVVKAQDGDTSAQKEFLKIAESTRIEIE
jgi:hypothetical protein